MTDEQQAHASRQKVSDLLERLEWLGGYDLDAVDDETLGQVEKLCHHWQQIAQLRLEQRRAGHEQGPR